MWETWAASHLEIKWGKTAPDLPVRKIYGFDTSLKNVVYVFAHGHILSFPLQALYLYSKDSLPLFLAQAPDGRASRMSSKLLYII